MTARAVKRYFAPGEPVRVVIVSDYGLACAPVRVLMRHLEHGGVEVMDVCELEVRPPEPLPTLLPYQAPPKSKRANVPHGPERKGAGGKVRKW